MMIFFFSSSSSQRCFRDTGTETLTTKMDFFGPEFFICKIASELLNLKVKCLDTLMHHCNKSESVTRYHPLCQVHSFCLMSCKAIYQSVRKREGRDKIIYSPQSNTCYRISQIPIYFTAQVGRKCKHFPELSCLLSTQHSFS